MAVGATARDVLVGWFLRPMLYGVEPYDTSNFAGVLLVLTAVLLVALLQPSLRAVRIDPARTLRHE